jgi:hypothetical protein
VPILIFGIGEGGSIRIAATFSRKIIEYALFSGSPPVD